VSVSLDELRQWIGRSESRTERLSSTVVAGRATTLAGESLTYHQPWHETR